eukprot:6362062-Alexandrium_andersonii.AAC.1
MANKISKLTLEISQGQMRSRKRIPACSAISCAFLGGVRARTPCVFGVSGVAIAPRGAAGCPGGGSPPGRRRKVQEAL